MIGLLLFATLTGQGPGIPSEFLTRVNDAVQSSQAPKVRSLFAYPDPDSKYLIAMAARRGGLAKLHASMIPTPPGWEGRGSYWVVIHTFQDIEEDHDPVFEVMRTGTGFQLGHEVREDDLAGWAITDETYTARLTPEDQRVDVSVNVKLHEGGLSRAPIFRLNDVYKLSGRGTAILDAGNDTVPKPIPNTIVRAGSLLIPWTAKPAASYAFKYFATLNRATEDKISPDVAYVTAWWLPSLGRLPFAVKGTIVAPEVWTVRGEGIQVSRTNSDGSQSTTFQCDLPISYPKVIGGLYKVAAEKQVGDQTFRIFQLDTIDQDRADHDLKAMVDAAAFFQSKLGPLPFPGYECYDADSYYGIESYSHTLLNRRITHFISHEMGHSYFGGLAPCPYVHDSWNEGATQYLDSVVYLKNADHSLENALTTLNEDTPLSEMPVAHANSDATYWRGCYVLKMLEFEVGPEKVMDALANLVRKRKGLDTRWRDLRPFLERSSGESLDWFWNQWIDGSQFPTLHVDDVDATQRESAYRTSVKVRQTGTSKPFRLKFALAFRVKTEWVEKVYDLSANSDVLTFDSKVRPSDIQIRVLPYTLARVEQFRRQTPNPTATTGSR